MTVYKAQDFIMMLGEALQMGLNAYYYPLCQ